MMMYLVKHSRPDLANPVRELSKVMDGARMIHFNELLRVIKHTLDNKDLGLKLCPIVGEMIEWTLKGLSDADFSTDSDTRKSVTGFSKTLPVRSVIFTVSIGALVSKKYSRLIEKAA